MAGERQGDKTSLRQMEDYLRGLKSSAAAASDEATETDESVEEYLLERAASDLRAARTRLENLGRSLDGD